MNYSGIVETTLAQIADKGRSVTLRSPSQSYDPATDAYTAGSATDTTVKAVVTKFASKDVDGELIKRNDLRVLIAANSLNGAPDTDVILIDGSTHYNVINVETVKPGDTAILYVLQVRK